MPEYECKVLFPARTIRRNAPQTIEPQVESEYVDRLEANQRERYLIPISGARIIGTSGLVVLPDGCYASESLYLRSVLEQDRDYYAPKRQPIVNKAGTYFSLIVIWSKEHNYYHWMHDTLERLFKVTELLPDDVKYIVPADMRPWQRETLRLVGIRDDQLAFFSGAESWELERLYFAPPTTNSASHRREADEWLRDSIMGAYQVTASDPTRRLFISRKGMRNRRIVNEDEVARYLQPLGFEVCMPETLSLREQVVLFAEASVVVSNHGSAYTNILFSAPGLVVVDMVQPGVMSGSYMGWVMCEELGHHYWYFLVQDSWGRPDMTQPDAYISIDKLAATFDRIGLD